MNIGEKIKFYRENKHISKSELARQIGVSPSYITMLENGDKSNPSMEILLKISNTLDINIADLSEPNNKLDMLSYLFAGSGKLIKDDTTESSVNKLNYLEQYIKTLGYEIDGDESEGYLVINTPEGTYEITEDDITDLTNTTKSFILFKLQEIIKHSRKIGK